MAIFGKRALNDTKYVVPPKSWAEPYNAHFFNRIGFKPNDPENIRVTPQDVARMVEQGRQSVGEKIAALEAKLNAKNHPPGDFRPFWMLQDNCWAGDAGQFLLYTLRLNPYEAWNTVILPADPQTARLLNLPLHPRANVVDFAITGENAILALRAAFIEAKAEAEKTGEFGKFADVFDGAVAKVKALALAFAKEIERRREAAPDGVWFSKV